MRMRWTIMVYSLVWPGFLMISLIYFKISLDQSGGMENSKSNAKEEQRFSSTVHGPKDKLLGGLLSANFKESSCLSRHQLSRYKRPSPHKPSPYLISKLRSYESMHKRCAPNTKSYYESTTKYHSHSAHSSSKCNYLVHLWMRESGFGNRLLSLVSSFLYSILTSRVLLIDPGQEMDGLFCEPFPNSTWLLPSRFPFRDRFKDFHAKSSICFGNMSDHLSAYKNPLPFVYINLIYDYNENDKQFFCERDQGFLTKVPWLFVRSDQYFIPSLFSISSFEKELRMLFPKTDTIFHHLGRYLLQPSNRVWGLVKRFYEAYLAKFDEKIGFQIRDYGTYLPFKGTKDYIFKYYIPHLEKRYGSTYNQKDLTSPLLYMMDKVFKCYSENNLLPRVINYNKSVPNPLENRKSVAAFVTSLNSMYFENLTITYSENPTINGEIVGVFQPSNERYQQNHDPKHNMKAFAEMYLLSMMDELITSPWSTFGYVAQGLGGLKPWVISDPHKEPTFGGSFCYQAKSLEPCFHFPPIHDCKAVEGFEPTKRNSYVRHCEDTRWGLQLFDDHEL